MALEFPNNVRFLASSSGNGDFTPAVAVDGFVLPSTPPITTGATVRYKAENNLRTEWEIGSGVWNGTTVARTTILLSSTGSKVSFSTTPVVGLTFFGADYQKDLGATEDRFKAAKTNGPQAATVAGSGGVYFKVTFNAETFDRGNHFSGSTWTPAAGDVMMFANVLFQGLLGTGAIEADIFKNGSSVAADVRAANGTTLGCSVTLWDTANGTDTYEVYGWQSSSGSATVYGGSAALSNFQGTRLL